MSNRYLNLDGSKKISETYTQIPDAFDKVQTEIDANKQTADTHIANTSLHTTAAEKTKLAGIATAAGTDGSATDAVIGNRTLVDTEVPTVDTGSPTKLFGWLANRVKAITGKSSWRTAPALTLEDTKTHVDNASIHTTAIEKTKLAGIAAGAEVNQNSFATLNDILATVKNDTLKLKGGTGITVTTNPSAKEVLFTATGQSTPGAHGSSHNINGADPIPDLVTLKGVVDGHTTDIQSALTKANAAETLSGAQTKADTAKTAANTYTDQKVAAIPAGSTSQKGLLQLVDSTSSTSTVLAPTANAVKLAMDQANSAFQSASDGKTAVASAITGKGVAAIGSDTFAQLATKIGQISTGKKFATGSGTKGSNLTDPILVTGLSFRPSVIHITMKQTTAYDVSFLYNSAWNPSRNGVQAKNLSLHGLSSWTLDTYDVFWSIASDGFSLVPKYGSNVTYTWYAFE